MKFLAALFILFLVPFSFVHAISSPSGWQETPQTDWQPKWVVVPIPIKNQYYTARAFLYPGQVCGGRQEPDRAKCYEYWSSLEQEPEPLRPDEIEMFVDGIPMRITEELFCIIASGGRERSSITCRLLWEKYSTQRW